MKIFRFALTALLLLGMGMNTPSSALETEEPKEKKVQIFDKQKIEEMSEMSETTEMHSQLAKLVGTWDYIVTFWPTPDAEPDISEGIVVNDMIYGERFLTTQANGMMSLGYNYVPYQGQGFMGYDKDQKVFTSVWIDNLSTGMQTGTGTYDEETDIINMTGNFMMPTKQKKEAYRAEIEFIGRSNYKYTQYTTDKSNKEFKTIEIVYRRKQ